MWKQFDRILHYGIADQSAVASSSSPNPPPLPSSSSSSPIPPYLPPTNILKDMMTTNPQQQPDIPFLERSDPRAIEFRNAFRTWFHNQPWSCISRKSVRLWLGWSMYNAYYHTLCKGQKEGIEKVLGWMERRGGAEFLELNEEEEEEEKEETSGPSSDDQDEDLKPLRVSLDPLRVESRPAIVYAVIHLVGYLALGWFEWMYGMKVETIGGLTYVKPPPTRLNPYELI